ncbi:hypothetical protein [Paracoccus sp. (in: a-proteobacteria)]|uniref:hypothetical protein n=1 Tax=Paracoccus sp. TaxID=267 RepID=UPI003A8B7C70
MSGTRSPSRTEPATDHRWPVRKLELLLYPAAVAAVWINLFMLSLLTGWTGLPALSPLQALIAALPVAMPAAWAAGRWIRRLMDRADGI